MCPARSALGPADQGEGYVRQRTGLLAGSGAASATDRRVRGERCTRPKATVEMMMMMMMVPEAQRYIGQKHNAITGQKHSAI